MYKISVIKNPKGTYSLVGTVPVRLCYQQANGEPLTNKQADAICHCGPGILSKKIKSINYKTEQEAIKVIESVKVIK